MNNFKAVANFGTAVVVSLVTFVSNLPSDDSNLQTKNRIMEESVKVQEVSVACNNVVYGVENFSSINKINTSLDSLGVTVNTREHQLVRAQSEPKAIQLSELSATEDNNEQSGIEDDTEEDVEPSIQTTEDEATNIEQTVEVVEEPKIITVDQSSALLEIENPQEDYTGYIVTLTDSDRYTLGRLVMGEAGNQGYEGAALVAQCIRDTMVYDGIPTVEQVRVDYKYSGHLDLEPNQDVLNAIDYIFDNGGIAVKHRIQYFYAPRLCNGNWHETQDFVIEYGGHKFFAKKVR